MKVLLVAFAATTLSIILTFGTTAVANRVKQKQERKLTALMVMSSIEQFARELDELEEILAHKDSIATWLLSLPIEEVAELGDPLWDSLVDAIGSHFSLARDKIGISEKEVMEFTDNLGEGGEFKEDELNIDDFDKPVPDVDSLNVQLSYARQIDSLRQAKKDGGK